MIAINMMSSATKIKGQGVGSAYMEQMNLMERQLYNRFVFTENFSGRQALIQHYHTVDAGHYWNCMLHKNRCVSVGSVHFLPETVDTSLNLPKPARWFFYKYLISFYKMMDFLVVVNPTFIPKLQAYGIPREKIQYIPNYVSEENFYAMSEEEKRRMRRKYGVKETAFTVLGVGQLQTRKGVMDFVEIARRMPQIQFVWAGGFSFKGMTDGYREIKAIVEHPPANVTFLGIVDREKMNEVYNLADVMFLPSFEELFPMAILESMSCQIPILLRDLDIYPEILGGYYTAGTDVDSFIREIARLREDREYYRTCSQAAACGHEFYSARHVAEIWEEFYQRAYHALAEKKARQVRMKQNIGEV